MSRPIAADSQSVTPNSETTQRALTQVATRVFEMPVPENNMLRMLPDWVEQVSPWADDYEVATSVLVGQAAWVSPDGAGVPMANARIIADTYPVREFALGWAATWKQIKQAEEGRSLNPSKAMAARNGIMSFHNTVLATGDLKHQIFGVANQPYTPRTQIDLALFETGATPTDTLAALLALENQVYNATGGTIAPTDLWLADAPYQYISDTILNQYNDRSILEVFISKAKYVKNVRQIHEFNAAGPNGEPIIACLTLTPGMMGKVTPTLLENIEPQQRELVAVQIYLGQSGGVAAPFPNAHLIGELR